MSEVWYAAPLPQITLRSESGVIELDPCTVIERPSAKTQRALIEAAKDEGACDNVLALLDQTTCYVRRRVPAHPEKDAHFLYRSYFEAFAERFYCALHLGHWFRPFVRTPCVMNYPVESEETTSQPSVVDRGWFPRSIRDEAFLEDPSFPADKPLKEIRDLWPRLTILLATHQIDELYSDPKIWQKAWLEAQESVNDWVANAINLSCVPHDSKGFSQFVAWPGHVGVSVLAAFDDTRFVAAEA
jgi:hypothetical protein